MSEHSDTPTHPETVGGLLEWAGRTLGPDMPSARREAHILMRHASGLSDTQILAYPEHALSSRPCEAFQALVRRRAQGEPIAYLTGSRAFRDLDLAVNSATLIPRADTELLVETALDCLPEQGVSALDLGTGSGAIALALASARPDWAITASELDAETLATARANGERLGLPLRFAQSHWFQAFSPAEKGFDLIVSNPPYIPENDPHLSQGDLRFEPRQALVAGSDGLRDIRQIIAQAPDFLRPKGWLMLEHGFDQSSAVQALMARAGFQAIETRHDLAGQPRVTLACLYS